MMNTCKTLISACVLLPAFTATQSFADTVLAFGPSSDYVTETNNDIPQATRTGTGPYEYLLDYSSTTPFSPASNYSGPTFYGGYMLTSTTVQGSSFQASMINNWSLGGGNDTFRLYANLTGGWEGSTLSFASLFVFKQADFISGYTSGSYSPDAFSITYRATGANGAFTPQGRWLVQIDGTFYLSEATIETTASNNSASISGATLSSTKWATYDPTSSLNFNQNIASFSDLDLSNVTAVGVYFEEDSYAGSAADTSAALLGLTSYSAGGTVIPEASQMSLFLAFGALMTLLTQRKRFGKRR
jgi:hypothetical protein